MEFVVRIDKVATDEKDGKKRCYVQDKSGLAFWCFDEKLFPFIKKERCFLATVEEVDTGKAVRKEIISVTTFPSDPKIIMQRETQDHFTEMQRVKSRDVARSVVLQEAVKLIVSLIERLPEPASDCDKLALANELAGFVVEIAKKFRSDFFGFCDSDDKAKESSDVVDDSAKKEEVREVKEVKKEPDKLPTVPPPAAHKDVPPVPPVPVKEKSSIKEEPVEGPGAPQKCTNCGKPVNERVSSFSQRNFGEGKIFCMMCQDIIRKKGKK